MTNSKFKAARIVLIFNDTRILIAVARSLHAAADITKGNLQAISFCCTGKYISSGGLYFRHLSPKYNLTIEDLDTLELEDYDNFCGEQRAYYTLRAMNRKSNRAIAQYKETNSPVKMPGKKPYRTTPQEE